MLAAERRNEILEKLQEDKRVIVSDLSQIYQVSEETIRRDLDRLEKDGFCTKSYGGAVLNNSQNLDLPLKIRKKSNVDAKRKIASIVAELIQDGERISMDASSTAVFVASALKEKEHLSIVTNSVEILLELSDVSGWNVISTGGDLKEGYLGLFGNRMIDTIESFYVDKTIISCKAFDSVYGFSDPNPEFISAKQAMMKHAGECIMIVDSSKFEKVSFAKVGNLKDIDVIVTDEKPDSKILNEIEEAGVRCLFPK